MNIKKIIFLTFFIALSFSYVAVRNFYPNLFTFKNQANKNYSWENERLKKKVKTLLNKFENILEKTLNFTYWSFEEQVKEIYLKEPHIRKIDETILDCFVKGNKIKQNKLDLAESYYRKALKLSKLNKDDVGEKISLFLIAEAYRMRRKVKKSIEIFKKSLSKGQGEQTQLLDAFIYRGLAKAFINLNNYEKAEEYLYKSIEVFKKNKELRGIISIYIDKASSSYYNSYNLESISNSLKAGDLLLNTSDPFGMGYVCINLGQVYCSLGEYKLAKELLEFSLRLFKKFTDIRGEAISLKSLGYAARISGHYEISKDYYDDALKLFKKVEHPQGIAECMNGLGKILLYNGNYKKAEKYFSNSLSHFKKINNKWAMAYTLKYLGDLYSKRGDDIKSEGYYWRSLGIFKEIKNIYGEACVYHKLGELFLEKEQYSEAKKYLQTAKSLFVRQHNNSRNAITSIILGHTEFKLGNMLEAKDLFKKTLEYYENIPSPLGKSRCLYGLGKIYSYQGDQKTAKKYFLAAYSGFEQIKYNFGKAKTIQLLGVTAYRSGYYISARNYFLTSLDLYKEIGYKRGYSETLCWLGATYIYLGKIQEAKNLLEKSRAEAIHKRSKALSYGKMGQIYALLGEFKKAISFYEKALNYYKEIGDDRWISIIHKSIGNLYFSVNDYGNSEIHFFQSLSFGKRIVENYELSRTYLHLSELESELGNFSLSDTYHKKAMENKKLFENKKLSIETFIVIGNAYYEAGKYNEAETYFSKAYTISVETKDVLHEAFSLLYMGRNDLVQKKLDRSRYKLEQALQLFTKMGFKRLIGQTTLFLTDLKFKQTHNKECLYNYNQLCHLFLSSNKKLVAEIFCNIGNVYNYYGEYEKALENYKKALNIIVEIKNFSEEGKILRKIGQSLIKLKRYSEAENYLELAKSHSEKSSNLTQHIKTNTLLGYMFYKLGNYKKAINILKENLIVANEKENLKEIGRCNLYIGITYIKLKDYKTARKFLEMALFVFKKDEHYWFQALAFKSIGKLECALKNNKKAIINYENANKIWEKTGNKIEQIYILWKILVIYKQKLNIEKEYKETKKMLVKKLKIYEKEKIYKLFGEKINKLEKTVLWRK